MTKEDSKVIRVSYDTLDKLEKYKTGRNSWESALQNLLTDSQVLWAIPEDLFPTKAKAKGEALKRAVKSRKDVEEPKQILVVASE